MGVTGWQGKEGDRVQGSEGGGNRAAGEERRDGGIHGRGGERYGAGRGAGARGWERALGLAGRASGQVLGCPSLVGGELAPNLVIL